MNTPQHWKEPIAGSPRGLSRRSVLKFGLGMVGSAALGATLAACASVAEGDDDVADDADEIAAAEPEEEDEVEATPEPDDDEAAAVSDGAADDRYDDEPDDFDIDQLIEEWHEEYEMFDIPELDLDNPEVEIQGETYDVWSYDNTWVGEVTDDLFIAFSIEEGYSGGAGEITAYACDSEDTSVYLEGELRNGDADLDDCVDKIKLSLDGDEITGTLTLEDQEPLSFTALPSEGDAGLYRIEEIEMGEIGVTPRWVVLEDGRVRGSIKCRNPHTGNCMQCPRPR